MIAVVEAIARAVRAVRAARTVTVQKEGEDCAELTI
jgi:hypothetical protein